MGCDVGTDGRTLQELNCHLQQPATAALLRRPASECKSVLGLVAVGDCSIDAAKKNGGITKVNHVDMDVMNILGIYGSYKVIVSGE